MPPHPRSSRPSGGGGGLRVVRPRPASRRCSFAPRIGCRRYYNGTYVLCTDPALVEAKFQKYNNKKGPVVDPSKLHWAPYPITVKRDKWTIRAKLQARTEEEM